MLTFLPIEQITAGDNDRRTFDPAKLAELAASIQENGLAQPITVRPINGGYQIVAGERRFRACQLLGLAEVPVIIREMTDDQASAVMLAENTARADLDVIDEAHAYAKRIAAGWTVEKVAQTAGVSEIRVQFRVKLLKLSPVIQQVVKTGNMTLAYAQALADAGLDSNRQLMAVRWLQAQDKPSLAQWRAFINKLATEQNQVVMFDLPLITGQAAQLPAPVAVSEPAHPATTKPPKAGRTAQEIVQGQVTFWQSAAEQWGAIGKPFKKQECQAAAQALMALDF